MNGKKYLIRFIINPVSGKGKGESLPLLIERILSKEIFSSSIYICKNTGEISYITKKSIDEGAEIIIAAGGDGTVNEVAKHLVHTDIVLGIIPSGSGNGLANHLKIPHDFEKAIEKINQLKIKAIDTGTLNSYFFVSVAGLGFDAAVAREYARCGKRGFTMYLKNCIQEYIRYRPAKYKISSENHIIARKALLITFANSDQFGYNTAIAPDAEIDDGFFNMCILKKIPLLYTPLVVEKLFRKKIHHTRYYESYRVSEATIYRKKASFVNIDGEPVKIREKTIHIVNHKQSLRVIV